MAVVSNVLFHAHLATICLLICVVVVEMDIMKLVQVNATFVLLNVIRVRPIILVLNVLHHVDYALLWILLYVHNVPLANTSRLSCV